MSPLSRVHSLRFIRRLAVIGAIVMLVSALLVAPVRYMRESEDIRQTAEAYNESMANSLALLVRDRVQELLLSHDHIPDPVAGRGVQYLLDSAFANLAQSSKLLKVKLFDEGGHLIYSTDANEEGEEGDAEDGAFALAMRDKETRSDLTFRPDMTTLTGQKGDRYVVASYVPVYADSGRQKFLGLFEIYSDVTDRKRAFSHEIILEMLLTIATVGLGYAGLLLAIIMGARDLDRAHQHSVKMVAQVAALSAAAEAKTRLLTAMSHHLKTPLNSIIGFSEMIEGERLGPIGDKRYARYAGDILDSGKRLLHGIDNILDYIRVDGGNLLLSPDILSPKDLLSGIVREMSPATVAAKVTLSMSDVPDDLTYLRADAKYLRQILRNLVDNAVRYNKPGGHVRLGAISVDAAHVAFTVQDDGAGIPAEELAGVFVPFGQRTQILTQFQDGFGIGLPLSKRIAELLGGSLSLEPRPEGGMVATLLLPRDPAEPAQATT